MYQVRVEGSSSKVCCVLIQVVSELHAVCKNWSYQVFIVFLCIVEWCHFCYATIQRKTIKHNDSRRCLFEAQKLTSDNYPIWKSWCKFFPMKANTRPNVELSRTNTLVLGEVDEIKQGHVKALYSINMSCSEDIFNPLLELTAPRVSWNTLKSWFEAFNKCSTY